VKWFLGIVLAIAVGLGAFYFLVAPPRQLDLLDRTWVGDAGARRVAHDVAYRGGPRQKLDVYDNPRAGTYPKPVLVFFYGGGWHGGDKDHYGFAARAYAAKGFLVVLPDYRLVPEVHFPAFLQDSAGAVAWTWRNAARFGGDPNRIVTAGHSAGAYNAIMPALDRKWLAAEGLPGNVIKAAAGLAGPYDFYPFNKPNSINAMGRYPRPLETQPIRFVRADAPPLWLGHGTADTSVRVYNSRNMAAALKAAGAPVTLREYPGSSHNDLIIAVSGLFRSRLPVFDESSTFLLEHSGRPANSARRWADPASLLHPPGQSLKARPNQFGSALPGAPDTYHS
jgi:acetyl esterase/lipase